MYKIKQKRTKHNNNIYMYIYNDKKKWNQKNMKKCDKWKRHNQQTSYDLYKKGKVIPLQARCGPEGG